MAITVLAEYLSTFNGQNSGDPLNLTPPAGVEMIVVGANFIGTVDDNTLTFGGTNIPKRVNAGTANSRSERWFAAAWSSTTAADLVFAGTDTVRGIYVIFLSGAAPIGSQTWTAGFQGLSGVSTSTALSVALTAGANDLTLGRAYYGFAGGTETFTPTSPAVSASAGTSGLQFDSPHLTVALRRAGSSSAIAGTFNTAIDFNASALLIVGTGGGGGSGLPPNSSTRFCCPILGLSDPGTTTSLPLAFRGAPVLTMALQVPTIPGLPANTATQWLSPDTAPFGDPRTALRIAAPFRDVPVLVTAPIARGIVVTPGFPANTGTRVVWPTTPAFGFASPSVAIPLAAQQQGVLVTGPITRGTPYIPPPGGPQTGALTLGFPTLTL